MRFRAVRLLKSLIDDSSTFIEAHIEKIFSCIEDGISDDVANIREQFQDCGRLAGGRFPFATWEEWFSTRLTNPKISSPQAFSRILKTLHSFLTGFSTVNIISENITTFENLCDKLNQSRRFDEEVI